MLDCEKYAASLDGLSTLTMKRILRLCKYDTLLKLNQAIGDLLLDRVTEAQEPNADKLI